MRTPHHRDILSPAIQIRSSELDRTRDLPVTNVSLRDEIFEDTGGSVRLVVIDERLINDADVRTAIRATSRRLPGSTHHNVLSRDSNLQALLRSISHLRRHLRLRRHILEHRIPLILRHRKISLTQEATIVQHAMSKPRHRNILLRTIQLVRRTSIACVAFPSLMNILYTSGSCSTRARVIRVLLHTILLIFDPNTYTPWSSLPVSGTSAPARSTMFSTVAETFRPASDASVTFAETFAFGDASLNTASH